MKIELIVVHPAGELTGCWWQKFSHVLVIKEEIFCRSPEEELRQKISSLGPFISARDTHFCTDAELKLFLFVCSIQVLGFHVCTTTPLNTARVKPVASRMLDKHFPKLSFVLSLSVFLSEAYFAQSGLELLV